MRRHLTTIWVTGLLRHRIRELAAAACGIAVAVSLVALLGAFLTTSQATLTQRARTSVATDWQVEVQPDADPGKVRTLVQQEPGDAAVETVRFGPTTGLSATSGASSQKTGSGVVLGVSTGYRSTFPDQTRQLAGSPKGVQIAQQTAANLRVQPGDRVSIGRAGQAPVKVTVAGIVAFPQDNSLFQKVGAPPQSQPSAPPDNVLLMPQRTFDHIFTTSATAGSGSAAVTTQFHIHRDAPLAHDPAGAYTQVSAATKHLEAASAGSAVVGDNLGAALAAARSDAAYARMLFLFLGIPGVILAALITGAVVAASADRRRRERVLLRTRGVSPAGVTHVALAEAATMGVLGSVLGLAVAAIVARISFGADLAASPSAFLAWGGLSALCGILISLLTAFVPAVRDLRAGRVLATGRATVPVHQDRLPWWLRSGLDLILLALAGVVFWASSANNYSLVLAPEGVPTISVSYWAFLGPALLWLGAAGLLTRIVLLLLRHGHRPINALLAPLAGRMSRAGASSISRRRLVMARSVVLLALALSFAASTATFNTTYAQQAEADAALTNGADVTVTLPPKAANGPSPSATLRQVPGVKSVEPMQHRYAYIGADLQDLYGIRPDSIGGVTALQDAYFPGSSTAQAMSRLKAHPNAVLVSSETVKDFQLQLGDTIKLRLPDPQGGVQQTVSFRYEGVVSEFPTAPKDSFFVANAEYVAKATGDPSVNTYLVNTGGRDQQQVAARVHDVVGTSATVSDITQVRGVVGSSLTSVSLGGLTRIELGYAIVLCVAAGALVLGLGLAERRRTFAIFSVLGAHRRELSGLMAGEGIVIAALGTAGAAVIGWALSVMLVKVLTGVFDPPPSTIAVPWLYLIGSLVSVIVAVVLVAVVVGRRTTRPPVEELREQ